MSQSESRKRKIEKISSKPMSESEEKSTVDARKAELGNIIKRLFTQLTVGCGRFNCANVKCASNIENNPWPTNEAAAASLRLAGIAKKENWLCSDANCFDYATSASLLKLAEDYAKNPKDEEASRMLIRRVGAIFGRWQCLGLSFRKEDNETLDVESVDKFFKAIPADSNVKNILQRTVERMLGELSIQASNLKERSLRSAMSVLIILFEQTTSGDNGMLLLLCRSVVKLPTPGQTALRQHWATKGHEWLKNLLNTLNESLTLQIMRQMESPSPIALHRIPDVIGIVTVLKLLFEINQQLIQAATAPHALIALNTTTKSSSSATATTSTAKTTTETITTTSVEKKDDNDDKMQDVDSTSPPAVPVEPFATYKDFQCDLLTEHVDLIENFRDWVSNSGFSFVNQPHVLPTELKAKVLHVQSLVQQRQHGMEAMRSLSGERATLSLTLKRERIVEDTFEQIQRVPARDLRKQLRITFEQEEAIDEGGVKKEWFQLLVREIFDPKYGMFLFNDKTRTYWFRRESQEFLYYNLMGSLLGMSIYNGVILDLHFPNVVYKLLLGISPVFEDLADVDAELYTGLKQLLAFEGDVEEVFERTFEVEYDVYGETRKDELKPNGANIALTADNKAEYVRLYATHVLITSVQRQWAAFKRGFDLVCDADTMNQFNWQELELIICGSATLDFDELEKGTVYDSKYNAEHPTIRRFWKAVHALSLEEKKLLLHFATGSDRAPIGGLRALRLVIVYQPDSDRLPSAHTCFNHLLLPDYQTDEKMTELLSIAIRNAQGFGML